MSPPSLLDLPEAQVFELVSRLDVSGPRYTSYPTVPVWQASPPIDGYLRALAALGADGRPIAVYVHLPFCKQRCLYCGCNSYITNRAGRMERYAEALLLEIDRAAERLPDGVLYDHLHIGGGTPTHFSVDLLRRILERLEHRIRPGDSPERSIEVDPRITSNAHLELLREKGFRRVSAGLQDLDPCVQAAVRREFSFERMKDFMERARDAGFRGINIDLIYGLPRQSRATWARTLEAVAELNPDRLACFGYAHLPARMKHQKGIDANDLPSPRQRLGMLLDANRFFVAHGYAPIGMDHFARPGDDLSEARRNGRLWRNFMGYTTIRGMELLGLGCSGISEFKDLFVQNLSSPEQYAEAILEGGWAIFRGHRLDLEDQVRKQIINNLMCNMRIELPVGIEIPESLTASLKEAMSSLGRFEDDGLLLPCGDGYAITELGQLFLRNLAMPFDRYLTGQQNVTYSRTV